MALASKYQPDFVLLDVNMPVISGNRLAELLHSNNRTSHIQTVFCLSDGEDKLREIARTCDVQGYIYKMDILDPKHKLNHCLGLIE